MHTLIPRMSMCLWATLMHVHMLPYNMFYIKLCYIGAYSTFSFHTVTTTGLASKKMDLQSISGSH